MEFSSTNIKKCSEDVTKHLNILYKLDSEILKSDIMILEDLLEDIDSWRICLDEIKLLIQSHNQYHIEHNLTKKEQNQLIIF